MERSYSSEGPSDRTESDWRNKGTTADDGSWSTVKRGGRRDNWKSKNTQHNAPTQQQQKPQQQHSNRTHNHHRNAKRENNPHPALPQVPESFLNYQLDDETYKKLSIVIQEMYMDGTQLSIPRETLASFIDIYGIEAVGHTLSRMCTTLEFPYKRYFIADINQKFHNLQEYRYTLQYDKPYFIPVLDLKTKMLTPFHYKGRFTIMPSEVEDYEEMNILIDYFQEDARIRSVAGYGTASTLEHWRNPELNKYWLYPLLVQQSSPTFVPQNPREDGIQSYTLREAMYPVVKSECTSFKATVSASIIRLFEAHRVLDFCAGWGDRLLGALSCQPQLDRYVGVDPNSELFPNYSAMIKTFTRSEEEASRFQMINSPFEQCSLPDDLTFDLIFTGPPYYDYEKYGTTGANQSITSFPQYADWLVHFLFFSIEKSWSRLDENGHLALNFSDVRQLVAKNVTITEVTNLWIQYKLLDAVYEGVICFTGANKPLPRPIWVYLKDSQSVEQNRERSKTALHHIKEHYPKVYKVLAEKDKLEE